MTKAGILASIGDLQSGAAASIGTGSATIDISSGNVTFPRPNRVDVPKSIVALEDGNIGFKGLDGYWDIWTVTAGDVISIAIDELASTANGSTGTSAVKVIY